MNETLRIVSFVIFLWDGGAQGFCSKYPIWRELNFKGSLDDKKTEETQGPGEREMTTSKFCVNILQKTLLIFS